MKWFFFLEPYNITNGDVSTIATKGKIQWNEKYIYNMSINIRILLLIVSIDVRFLVSGLFRVECMAGNTIQSTSYLSISDGYII